MGSRSGVGYATVSRRDGVLKIGGEQNTPDSRRYGKRSVRRARRRCEKQIVNDSLSSTAISQSEMDNFEQYCLDFYDLSIGHENYSLYRELWLKQGWRWTR